MASFEEKDASYFPSNRRGIITNIASKRTWLTDKEVEAVFLSYRGYFKVVRSGKELELLTSIICMKDDLFERNLGGATDARRKRLRQTVLQW